MELLFFFFPTVVHQNVLNNVLHIQMGRELKNVSVVLSFLMVIVFILTNLL